MATIAPFIFTQFFDNNGDPLALGKVYFYAPGTSTLQDTYDSAAADSVNDNPVILDSAGRADIFGDLTYDVEIYDADDALIDTKESVAFSGTSGGNLFFAPSLIAAKALAPGASDYVMMTGELEVGDGRQRLYYWDADSALANNDITVIKPVSDPATGRLIYVPNNAVLFHPLGRSTITSAGGASSSAPTSIDVSVNSTTGTLNMFICTPPTDAKYYQFTGMEHGQTICLRNTHATNSMYILTEASGASARYVIVYPYAGQTDLYASGYMTYDATALKWYTTFQDNALA